MTTAPPNNRESEVCVLGSMFLDQLDALPKACDLLKPEDFYYPENHILFKTMRDLGEDKIRFDIAVLRGHLLEKGILDRIGGSGYLTQILESVPSSANITYYADLVHTASQRRKLIVLGQGISRVAIEGANVKEILNTIEAHVKSIESNIPVPAHTFEDVLLSGIEELMRLKQKRDSKGDLFDFTFGIIELDSSISCAPKRVNVFGAIPRTGKTTYALNMMIANSMRGFQGVFFSLEMDETTIGRNIIINQLGLDNQLAQFGYLSEDQAGQIAGFITKDFKGFVRDASQMHINEIRSEVRRLKAEHGITYAIVDYLQRADGSGKETRHQVGDVALGLAKCAKESDIVMNALAQPNRKYQDRKNKRLYIADLAESAQIEREAYTITMLHREWLYDKDHSENDFEFNIRKNRDGVEKTVHAYCDMSRYIIADKRIEEGPEKDLFNKE